MRKSPAITTKLVCKKCQIEFTPRGNRQFFCADCKKIADRERKAKWYIAHNPNAFQVPINAQLCIECGSPASTTFQNRIYCNKHWQQLHLYGVIGPHPRQRTNTYDTSDGITKIMTRKGKIITIDYADFDLVTKYSWCVVHGRYAVANVAGKITKLHNYLMIPPSGFVVDHINGYGLDNRRCNLRVCLQLDNMKNNKLSSNNSTGYPGVRLTPNKKFESRIMVNRKAISLGTFSTLAEAINARVSAEVKYYGEYAPSLGVLKGLITTSTLGQSE